MTGYAGHFFVACRDIATEVKDDKQFALYTFLSHIKDLLKLPSCFYLIQVE